MNETSEMKPESAVTVRDVNGVKRWFATAGEALLSMKSGDVLELPDGIYAGAGLREDSTRRETIG